MFKMVQNTEIERYRYVTLLSKEPETIAWIDDFEVDGCFIDVGANIGIYSLYCAMKHDMWVYAFEPFTANYVSLCRNKEINYYDTIIPIHGALGSVDDICTIMPKENPPIAGTTAYTRSYRDTCHNSEIVKIYKLDSFKLFNFSPEKARYIKIDVDGAELEVLEGMEKTLKSGHVRSILVETIYDELVTEYMKKCGYIKDMRYESMKNHSSIRRTLEGIEERNIIYIKS